MRTTLARVRWIGGSTDAGKTSVARIIAAKHGWQEYHDDRYDRFESPGHWARIDPSRHPHLYAERARTMDDRWVNITPEAMIAGWQGTTPERFKRASYARRGKGRFADTSDPERARRNHIGRDLLIAAYVNQRARELGLTVVVIDGTRSLEKTVAQVDAHFARYLRRA